MTNMVAITSNTIDRASSEYQILSEVVHGTGASSSSLSEASPINLSVTPSSLAIMSFSGVRSGDLSEVTDVERGRRVAIVVHH